LVLQQNNISEHGARVLMAVCNAPQQSWLIDLDLQYNDLSSFAMGEVFNQFVPSPKQVAA